MDDLERTEIIESLPEPNGEGDPVESILGVIRAKRAEQVADRTLDLDVPGYGGLIGLRLGPVRGQVLSRILERARDSRSPEKDYNANADTLIAATREVLIRMRPEDEWTVLPDDDGEPVKMDDRLASRLGLEATKAREVVRELFGQANAPELAVGATANEYVEWATATNAEADETLMGESQAEPR